MKHLFVILLLTISTISYGQNNDKVAWTFKSEETAPNEYTVYLSATIQDGWYVYSQYLESDDGPVRTEVIIENMEGVTTDGKAKEEGTMVKGYDQLFDMNITKFKKHFTISQKLKVKGSKTLKGYVTFMSCNDEQCLPPVDVPFELKLK